MFECLNFSDVYLRDIENNKTEAMRWTSSYKCVWVPCRHPQSNFSLYIVNIRCTKLLYFPEDRHLCHFFDVKWQMEFLKVINEKSYIYSDNYQISVNAQEGW